MSLNITQIANKVEALKRRNASRDARMGDVLEVRRGNLVNVFPEMFPEGATKAMIANFVDVAARDVSEVLAPLPSFNCTSSNISDRAKKFADTKTLIANNYVQFSRLQTQMYQGADWYGTYGFLPIVVEADQEANMPRIRVENPLGSYPEYDRYGRVVSFTKRYRKIIAELLAEFPEYESEILNGYKIGEIDLYSELEMIRYEDKDVILLYLPSRGNLVLAQSDNPMGEVMVRVARRPGIDDEPRGQFDDVLWVQIARARFAQLAMDGHEEFSGMRSAMKELKYLARDTNACILVLHHTKEGFIGTPCQPRSAVQGMVNQIPALILTIGQEIIGDSTYLCVAPVKNRYGKADATGGSFVMLSFDPSTMQLKDVHTND